MKHSSSNGCFSLQFALSHLLCWKGTPNLEICVKFESQHRSKWYGATHKWLVNAVKSFSHLPYASKEGYETLKQQWLSLLAVQYHICCAERVPQIWKLVWNLRVNIGRNDTVQHSKWLVNAVKSISHLPYAYKEGYETLKQQWLSLVTVTSISFVVLRGYPKSGNLCEIWESTSEWNDTVQHINGWWMLSKASPICPMHLRKVMKHSSSNGWLSTASIGISHLLCWEGRAPNLEIGVLIWESTSVVNDMVQHINGWWILPKASTVWALCI